MADLSKTEHDKSLRGAKRHGPGAWEVMIGLMIFVFFLAAYIWLGEVDESARNAAAAHPTDYSALQDLLRNHNLLLPAVTLLAGCSGTVYWRLMGLAGRIEKMKEEDKSESDASTAAMLLVGAISGVFCAFVLPGALLRAGSGLEAYNTRALALLALVAGYGGCNAFGNIGRLVSDILEKRHAPFSAATLREAIEPLGETVISKFDERFAPAKIPRYKGFLSCDLLVNGMSVLGPEPASSPVVLLGGTKYALSVNLNSKEARFKRAIELSNENGEVEEQVPFDIEIEADGLSIIPSRTRLFLKTSSDNQDYNFYVDVPNSVTADADDDVAVSRLFRIAAYCQGSPAGKLLISFSLPPYLTLAP